MQILGRNPKVRWTVSPTASILRTKEKERGHRDAGRRPCEETGWRLGLEAAVAEDCPQPPRVPETNWERLLPRASRRTLTCNSTSLVFQTPDPRERPFRLSRAARLVVTGGAHIGKSQGRLKLLRNPQATAERGSSWKWEQLRRAEGTHDHPCHSRFIWILSWLAQKTASAEGTRRRKGFGL